MCNEIVDVIAMAAHFTQLFEDSECWYSLGLEPSTSRTAVRRSTNWDNQAAISSAFYCSVPLSLSPFIYSYYLIIAFSGHCGDVLRPKSCLWIEEMVYGSDMLQSQKQRTEYTLRGHAAGVCNRNKMIGFANIQNKHVVGKWPRDRVKVWSNTSPRCTDS